MSEQSALSLHDKALHAAFLLSGGDTTKTFTGEDILAKAWENDHAAWGLRGYEERFPDSNKLYTKLDGKDGLVGLGFLRNVGPRTYQITETGVHHASRLVPTDEVSQIKIERQLQDAVLGIIDHPTFQVWLRDPTKPTKFRELGAFWGIAPGTPARVVRARVDRIEQVLRGALEALDAKNASDFIRERGAKRYEREDLVRCLEFQRQMKERFAKDLAVLDPNGRY